MLRGNKPEEKLHTSNRTKLPLESGIRSFKGIKELLTAAEANKGKQIELEWTTGTPGQSFVLDVQWDLSSEDPIWSLYEENNGGSKKLWSQPFAALDLELFYDVLVMSCGAPTTSSSKKLSEILKPKVTEEKDGQSKFTGGESKDSKSPPEAKNEDSAANNAGEKPAANAPPAAAPQPTSLPNQGAVPFNPAAYPPYNMPGMPPGFPGMPYPPMMPPGMPQGQGYMTPPVMPPPGWTYTPVSPNNTGQMMAAMQNPYAQAPAAPQQQSLASSLPIDSALVNKNYEMSLLNLLKQAELISKPALDATIKIQNLIQDGTVPFSEGIKVLKQHHQKGDAIETVIRSNIPFREDTYKEASAAPAGMGKGKPLSKEKTAAFELLEKAGLLTSDDLTTAKNVVRKHGGDLTSILKAAQKLDDKTYEAALVCVSLIEEDLMKLEQCVIALNYCSRSRVGFDEAMDELNWPNPRQ